MKPTQKLRILWFMLWKLIWSTFPYFWTLCDCLWEYQKPNMKYKSPVDVGIPVPKHILDKIQHRRRTASMLGTRKDPTDYMWWPLGKQGKRARIKAVIAAMFRALWQLLKHIFTFQWTYGL